MFVVNVLLAQWLERRLAEIPVLVPLATTIYIGIQRHIVTLVLIVIRGIQNGPVAAKKFAILIQKLLIWEPKRVLFM
jgi:hypothetical protein